MRKTRFNLKDYTDKIDHVALKEKRLKHKESLTLSYQLGRYVGEKISVNIPSLSCDGGGTRKVHTVTTEEQKEVDRLYGLYRERNDGKDQDKTDEERKEITKLFYEYRKYVHTLEKKYFPPTIDLIVNLVNVPESEIDDFKRGISRSLWDSDTCTYNLNVENITVEDDESLYFTKIKLKYLGHEEKNR